ncbi:hypothetical protein RR45_GL000001 [Lactococcus chungangensis CAU 28 = DSM 22330]|nr:hypothetical protein RR45_GL000001 [Lactococcus chungangensis CAU 28 = DSM 22330]
MITIERYRCVTCGMTQSSQIPEQLVLKGHKDSTLLKTQIIRRLTEKESIKDASHDLNVSSHSFYQLIITQFLPINHKMFFCFLLIILL